MPNDLQFAMMNDLSSEQEVLSMMNALYAQDPSAPPADVNRFPQTIRTLVSQPSRGQILLILDRSDIAGYALLIPYWSNEFGGSIVYVDELFVKPQFRSRGMGRAFFQHIRDSRPYDSLAAMLEVSPGNSRAIWLYESVGFRRRKLMTYTMSF